MDDFERKLSVAFRTATADLAPPPAVTAATVVVEPAPPPRRRRPGAVLVAAVLMLLAVLAGGGWWAAVDRDRTESADPSAACTGDDVTLTHEDVPGYGAVRARVVVTAKSACTLVDPPEVTVRGRAVPFGAVDTWVPPRLDRGESQRFGIDTTFVEGLSCPIGIPEPATARLGSGGTPVTFGVPPITCSDGYVLLPA